MPGRASGRAWADRLLLRWCQQSAPGEQTVAAREPLWIDPRLRTELAWLGSALDRLFRRWANGPDGRPMEVEVGSCSDGFGKLEPVLGPLVREARVGGSRWRAFPVWLSAGLSWAGWLLVALALYQAAHRAGLL